jgi:hypothetical protein
MRRTKQSTKTRSDKVIHLEKTGGRLAGDYQALGSYDVVFIPSWMLLLILLLLTLLAVALGGSALGITLSRGHSHEPEPQPQPQPQPQPFPPCELRLPFFSDDYYSSLDCGDVSNCISISQADIDANGTFRIRESNCPGTTCCAYVTEDLYWNDPVLESRPILGWSAMITIERSNVDLCLNGKTLTWNESAAEKIFDPTLPFLNPFTTPSEDDIVGFQSFNFEANFNLLFIFISLNSFPGSPLFALEGAVFALGYPDTFTNVPPYFYNQTISNNITIRNGIVGHGPHMGIQSVDNSNVVIRNVKVFDVPVEGISLVLGGPDGWVTNASTVLVENCTVIGTTNDTIFTLGNLDRISYGTTMFLGLATLDPTFGPIIAAPKPPDWLIPRDFSFGTGEVTIAQIQQLIWNMNVEMASFPSLMPGNVGYAFANTYGISIRPTINRLALVRGPNPFYPKECLDRASNVTVRNNVVNQIREEDENYVLIETNSSLIFHFILNPNWVDFFTGPSGSFQPTNFIVLGLVLGYPFPEIGIYQPNLDFYQSLIPSGTLNETLFLEYAHPLFGYNRDGSVSEGTHGIQTWCEQNISIYNNHVSEVYNFSPDIQNITDLPGYPDITASVFCVNEQRRADGFIIVNVTSALVACNTIEGIFSANVFVPPTLGTVASIRFIYQDADDIVVVDNSLGV